jgi:3-methyladenine DNA glycosylase Mpg
MKDKAYRKNRGSTMVEVLIGFTLLIILVAGFTKVIEISNTFIIKSKDLAYETELLEEKLYKDADVYNVSTGISLVEKEDYDGTGEAESLALNGVVLKTYVINGNNGAVYISRFSDED